MTWMGSAWKWAAVLLAISVLCMGCGERNPKKCRVAVLNCDNVLEAVVDGFKDGMAKLGYVEGQSVEYLYDGPVMGEMEDIAARAKELAALRPDLVLAIGTPSALSFHEALGEREIPILFAVVDDPVGCGLIESAARPGGHITGVTYFGLQEAPRLKWMTVLAPNAKRLYCPCNADNQGTSISMKLAEEAAAKLGVELCLREVRDMGELLKAIEEIPADVDAIYLPPDSLICSRTNEWIALSMTRKLPLSVANEVLVERGALYSYGFSFFDTGSQAARLADQIRRGRNPGDLPVEVPDFFLSVNLNTAEQIGLEIPDNVLRQADRIIR